MTSIKNSLYTRPSHRQVTNKCKANAVLLNNKAWEDIGECRFPEAIDHLSSALKESKKSMSETTEGDEDVLKISLDSLMIESQNLMKRNGKVNVYGSPSSSFEGTLSTPLAKCHGDHRMCDARIPFKTSKDGYRLYATPIHIPHQVLIDTEDKNNILLSAVIIFNLAVAYHLFSIQVSEQSQRASEDSAKYLRKAIKLYEFAVQIQKEAGLSCESSTLFVLSTLNNLGVAHDRLGHIEASDAHFQRLLSFLMFLVESHLVTSESMSYLNLFFDNTFHLVCANRGIAAPAA